MALSAAFSIIMIITGVARTGGNIASLKRLARWPGATTRVNEPLAPMGIERMRLPSIISLMHPACTNGVTPSISARHCAVGDRVAAASDLTKLIRLFKNHNDGGRRHL